MVSPVAAPPEPYKRWDAANIVVELDFYLASSDAAMPTRISMDLVDFEKWSWRQHKWQPRS